ncbi:helix-turn-helix domain-containing protein [Streptomyces griseoincarnatus]
MALEDSEGWVSLHVEPVPVDPAVATEVRECRMLSADEVAQIAEEYQRGVGVNELARRYGAHRQTIDRHLERAGVSKRPLTKMTLERVEQAKRLYDRGLSTYEVAEKLDVSASTIWKALKRAGVQMRDVRGRER